MRRYGASILIGTALGACSDPAAPAAGTFRAQLSGARAAALTGPSNAETIFTEEFPDLGFAIRMFALQGDTVRVLLIHCPGTRPLPSGEYELDASGERCVGRYSRVVSTPDGGLILLERAIGSSGRLTIGPSEPGQTAGSFSFSGPLLVNADSVGTLRASGTFSAELL